MSARHDRRTSRQLFRLCLAGGELRADRVREVVRALSASRRRNALAVLTHFHRLVRLDRRRHAAAVESAVPLPADLRRQVTDALARVYGPQLETTFAENPSLISGVRVSVGSDVYDGSVRLRLATLGRHE